MKHQISETIVAISTPIGNGGVGVIRCSGSDTFSVINKIFSKDISNAKEYSIIHGDILNQYSNPIDNVLLSIFRAPKSYTGDDTIEISAHGNMIILSEIIEACLWAGARMAEPGEFTKNAFLNGKIDLSQAEAVNDLIKSQTNISKNIALKQLSGGLKEKLSEIDNILIKITAQIEASLDFPEDVEEPDTNNLKENLLKTCELVNNILKSNESANIFREGMSLAIAGSVNVGKSSLLNAFLNKSRAIVTHIPGTTRDTLEETINIKGIPISAIDTAGVRDTDDIVEQIGVERSKSAINTSDLILCIFDASRRISEEDKYIFNFSKRKKMIAVINKIDSKDDNYIKETEEYIKANSSAPIAKISTKVRNTIDLLEDIIYNSSIKNYISTENILVTNKRHTKALQDFINNINLAIVSIENKMPLDLVNIDITGARNSIGKITGTNASEDLLHYIFSQFCIGK